MTCNICGHEGGARYRATKGVLCEICDEDTPVKIGRVAFDEAYWNGQEDIDDTTKRLFYDDYRSSNCTLVAYIATTGGEA